MMEKIATLKETVRVTLKRVEELQADRFSDWMDGYEAALEFVLEEIDDIESA